MRIMNKHETKEISSVNLPTINYSVVRKTDWVSDDDALKITLYSQVAVFVILPTVYLIFE